MERPTSLIAALGLVAFVPAVGVLWFMSVAMRNERLAVQERLTAVYASHLTSLRDHATQWVKARQDALAETAKGSPSEIFAGIVRANLADAVVVYDAVGKALYPAATPVEASADENSEQARVLQAQAAELLKAGQKEQALAKFGALAGDVRLRNAVGMQGTLIVPNAQLLILKTADVGSPPWPLTRDALVQRVNDYSDGVLPSSQRRFLMEEVQALAPTSTLFSTFAAEKLAAEYLEREPAPPTDASAGGRSADHSPIRRGQGPEPVEGLALAATGIARVWRLPSADRTVVALLREEPLRVELEKFLAPFVLTDARVAMVPPSVRLTAKSTALSLDAGELLPGWRLALSFRNGDPLAEASTRQTRFYLWVGVGMVAVIGVVALSVARYVSAQMRLARLKNELVSTVSHELKTPLASMRALVDTLLAGRYRDGQQLHEYLQLAAKENQRLSHLIENFLAFSRMERGRERFQFENVPPQEIVRLAVEGLGDKLTAPQCGFTTRFEPDLPLVRADADALATVLINLLDNACKYTNGDKRVELRTHATDRHVVFEVKDNGVGIAPGETRKIFDRFYQVDQSLTRSRGGCGLGLSIVDRIVRAHRGEVEVESEPGRGSTFRVKIPVADAACEPVVNAAPETQSVNRGLHGEHR